MEEEATQPATQIIVDPRRLGQGNSGLSDEDLADICCIIYPTTLPAYRAFSLIHDQTPEYTITSDVQVPIREKDSQHEVIDTFELAAAGVTSCGLVLRLSAKLKDPVAGFCFGRHGPRCDFVIGQYDKSRRISNTHFRIYINEYGVIMLEDQSTNGTIVDGKLLRGKEKDKKFDYRHTLETGSVITLTMTPPEQDYQFFVWKPQRDLEADRAYEQNLTAFFLRMSAFKQQNEARAGATGAVRKIGDPVSHASILLQLVLTLPRSIFFLQQAGLRPQIHLVCQRLEDMYENGVVALSITRLDALEKGLLQLFIR
jgi:hypothetical protein